MIPKLHGQQPSAPRSRRRTALRLIRTGVSLGLLIYLLLQIDLTNLLSLAHNVRLGLLALALLLQVGGVFLSGWKWWLLLRASGRPVPFLWAVQTYLVGQFFNNFLPTMIGGDAIRVYRLNQRIKHTPTALTSVFVERLTGFLALDIIAAFALVRSAGVLRTSPSLFWAAVWCVLVAGGALLGALAAPLLARGLLRLPLPNVLGWRGKLQMVAQTLAEYYSYGRTLVGVMVLSFAYQLSWISVNYAVIRALNLPVPFSFAALMVPISDIIGLVPIFLNSIGARSGTFLLLLRQIGIVAASTVALSFLVFMVRMLVSLTGGIIYLLHGVNETATDLRYDIRAAPLEEG